MLLPSWIVLLLILGFILLLSKYEISIVLGVATFIFAILSQIDLFSSVLTVITNLSVVLLAIAFTNIPILGGFMEESGLMMELVQKLRISRKVSMISAPALYGLLPVPGGALMSAPILEQINNEMIPERKVAINVWFRHIFLLIYPLTTGMILASLITGISLYIIFLSLIPSFLVLFLLGYLFFVSKLKTEEHTQAREIKRVLRNFVPIIVTPLLDVIGRIFFPTVNTGYFLIIGLIISVSVAIYIGKVSSSLFKDIIKKMKTWRFPLLIFVIFWFLEVFILSGIPEEIGALNMSFVFFLLIGFFLGFILGEVQVPFSILAPIYLVQFSLMPIFDFALLYTIIFLGTLITPIHPCVTYSVDYFDTNYKNILKELILPVLISVGILFLIYFITWFF